jgi:hypothetical protein
VQKAKRELDAVSEEIADEAQIQVQSEREARILELRRELQDLRQRFGRVAAGNTCYAEVSEPAHAGQAAELQSTGEQGD